VKKKQLSVSKFVLML